MKKTLHAAAQRAALAIAPASAGFVAIIALMLLGAGGVVGQTITVTSLTPNTICSGGTTVVAFSWSGLANANEIKTFFAQYENPSGSWNDIGSVNVTGGGNGSGSNSITSSAISVVGTFPVRIRQTAGNGSPRNSGNTINLTITPLPQGSIIAIPLCDNEPTANAQLQWSATLGTPPFTLVYNPGNVTVPGLQSGDFFSVAGLGTYTLVSVTDNNGCVRTSGFTGGGTATVVAVPAPELTLTTTVDKMEAICGEEVKFSVQVSNIDDITGLQFEVEWPTSLSYQSYNASLLGNVMGSTLMVMPMGNKLTLSWSSDTPVDLDAGDVVLEITFIAAGSTGTAGLTFVQTPLTPEVTNSNLCKAQPDVVQTAAVTLMPVACMIMGAEEVCPGSTNIYGAPAGAINPSWSILTGGNGTIDGAANMASVAIIAGDECGQPYTLRLEYTDEDGCVNVCEVEVMVTDNEDPTADQGTIADCYETVADAEAAAIAATTNLDDNCTDAADLVVTASTTGTCAAVVTVRVTDECGNFSEYVYNTRIDNEDPTADQGTIADCYETVADAEAAAIAATTNLDDNCTDAADLVVTASTTGTCAAVVTVRVTDECGNFSEYVYNTRIDNEDPTADQGTIADCYETVADAEAAAIAATTNLDDNCTDAADLVVTASTTGTCAAVVTVRVTDECGNFSEYVYNTRIDNEDPTADQGTIADCYETVADAEAAAIAATTNLDDNCTDAADLVVTASTTGTCAAVVTVRVTDECGNFSEYVYNTRIDNEDPTADQGTIADCYETVADAEAAAIAATTNLDDNCTDAADLVVTASTTGTCAAVVTVRVTDECGNFSEYAYNTRIDNEDPTADQGTIADCYETVADAEAAAIAATTNLDDNCTDAADLVVTASTTGTCAAVVTVRVTDECGNFSEYVYNTRIDNEDPTADQGTIADCYETVADAEAAAIAATTNLDDNCTDAADLVVTASTTGTCAAVVTVRVTDECGNFSEYVYNTRIDNEDPTADQGTIADCYETVADAEAAAIAATTNLDDNCTDAADLVVTASTTGTCAAVVTVRVTDECGNFSEYVYNTRIDNEDPTADQGTIADCYETVADAEAAAIAATTNLDDNCTDAADLVVTASTTGTCAAVVTVRVTDECGNFSEYVYNTRIDNEDPTADQGTIADCYETVADAEAAAIAATTNLDDNCTDAADLVVTASTTGTCAAVVTVRVTDECGNFSEYVYNTRIDNEDPTADQGTIADCYETVADAEAAAIAATTNLDDNCTDAADLVVTASTTGTCAAVVTVRVTDECGNFSEYAYNTRIDNEDPTADQGTIADCYETVADAEAAAIAATTNLDDNCTDAADLVVTASTTGTCAAVVTVRVTDECGNFSEYVYNTRIDNEDPTADQGTIADCYETVADAEAAAIAATTNLDDNCTDAADLVVTASTTGTCAAVVTVRVTDECGNFSEYAYNTRIDNEDPTADQGTIADCYETVADAEAAAIAATTNLDDNCTDAADLVVTASTTGTCAAVVTVRVTDECGNFSEYVYNTRIDNEDPTADQGTIADCYETVADAEAAAIAATTNLDDNCTDAADLVVTASTTGTCAAVVTVRVTDECGNFSEYVYNTRIDNEDPTADQGTIADCYETVADAEAAAIAATTNLDDNCTDAADLVVTASTTGTCAAVVTVRVTDECGNFSEYVYNTRIDNEDPTADQGTIADCYETVADAEAAAIAATTNLDDNCTDAADLVVTASTTGTCAAVVTVRVTDECGNFSEYVYNTRIDNEDPTADQGTIADCYETVADAEAAAIAATTNLDDNCTDAADLVVTASTTGTCAAVVTVRVTDECGNFSEYVYNTRIDNEDPTADQGTIADCYETVADAEAAAIAATTNLDDNCTDAADLVVTASTTGTCAAVVTVRVTDECGNFSEYVYNTRIDNEDPTADQGTIADCYETVADAEAAAIAATTNLDDNCTDAADLVVTASTTGTCAAVVTVRVTDECGNFSEYVYNTRIDNEDPTADQGTIADCYETVADAEAAAIAATTNLDDNCTDAADLVVTASTTGTCAAVVTVRVTDECGNFSEYVYNTRIDNEDPTADQGTIADCYETVADAEAAAIAATTNLDDNCTDAADLVVTASTTGTCAAVVTVRVTDECGNFSEYVYNTRIDNEDPTADQGTIADCYETVADAEAAAIAATTNLDDNCTDAADLVVTASTTGTCAAVVTVRVTDECGNFSEYAYNTRIDNEDPTADQGTIADCYETVADAEAAAIAATTNLDDNCTDAADLVVTASTTGTCAAVVTVRVTDECGNFSEYVYNTRIDNEDPTADQGTIADCYETVADAEAAAIAATTNLDDNCTDAADLVVTASTTGTCAAVVTVRVTDECGNFSEYVYNTRIDNEDPTADQGTIADCYETVADAEAAAIAATTNLDDNCTDAADLVVTASTTGTCAAVVTVRVTDECGNFSEYVYNTRIDNEDPTADQGTIADCYETVADAEAAAIAATTNLDDNCTDAADLVVTASTTGTCAAVVTVRVTDECGNFSEYVYNTRIDNEDPTADQGTIADCYETVADAEAAAIAATTNLDDNCTDAADLVVTASTTGTCAAVVTVRVTDECGNFSEYVYNTRIDNEDPTADQGTIADCYETVADAEAAAIAATTNLDDNCTDAADLVVTASTTGTCAAVVTVRVTDECGNFSEYVYNTRIDNEDPTADQGTIADCYETVADAEAAAIAATTNLDDNCTDAADLVVTASTTGTCAAVVTVRVTDECGNFIEYAYNTRIDGEGPTLTCPSGSPFTRTPDPANCLYTVVGNEFDPTADDNCGGMVTLTNSFNGMSTLDGAQLPQGDNIITWTATDACGNPSTCQITVTVGPCFEVSGKLIWKGFGSDDSGIGLATVFLTGPSSDMFGPTAGPPAANAGEYFLQGSAPGAHTIRPEKNVNMFNNGNVDMADVSAIQMHLVGSMPIMDFYHLVAADVNKNNVVSTQDATILRQAIAGNPTALAILNNTKSWRFISSDYVPGTFGPFILPNDIQQTRTVSASASNQNFFGVKIGDVGGTEANPANLTGSTVEPVVWYAQDRYLQVGDTVEVDFAAWNFEDIAAYQFALDFDPAKLQFQRAEVLQSGLPLSVDGNFGLFNVQNGEIRALFASTQGHDVPGDMPVFRLRFTVQTNGEKLSEVLQLDPMVLAPKAYNRQLQNVGLQLHYLEATVTSTAEPAARKLELLQNRPNPFHDETVIGFVLPEACAAQLRILDITGRELRRVRGDYAAGYNEERLQLQAGYSGVLIYELSTPFGVLTRKMMVTRL
jgi:hypothetical protein